MRARLQARIRNPLQVAGSARHLLVQLVSLGSREGKWDERLIGIGTTPAPTVNSQSSLVSFSPSTSATKTSSGVANRMGAGYKVYSMLAGMVALSLLAG